MNRALALVAVVATGCGHVAASTPEGRLHQKALATKAFVDATGELYLAACQEVVRPRCVEADRDATDAGKPQTQDDRVACLGACSSDTAAEVQTLTGHVRTAQLAVWRLLATGADPAELQEAERELRAVVDALLEKMRSSGVDKLIGGPNG